MNHAMPTNETSPRPRLVRMILALSAFAVASSLAVYWQLEQDESPKPRPEVTTGPSEVDTLMFYRSIGSTPDGFHGDEEAPIERRQFTVELDVQTSPDEAQALVTKLTAQGLDAFYTPLQRQGHVVFRIREGIFDTEAEAEARARELRLSKSLTGRATQL